jgi:hypothetical protein
MFRNMDRFDKAMAAIMLMGLLAVIAASIGSYRTKEVPDSSSGFYKVDGVNVHEIHPKPGITCFLVFRSGLSCIKD